MLPAYIAFAAVTVFKHHIHILRMVAANLSADSQPKSVGLVWGLAATRRSVCIHQMNRVNSRNDYVMMTAP